MRISDWSSDVCASDRSMRPEINSVVHTHAHWMVTQSALGRPPRMWHNLSGYFFNKVAMSPDDTIEAISPVLGDNIAIIMPWHGSITLGKTVGEEIGRAHV